MNPPNAHRMHGAPSRRRVGGNAAWRAALSAVLGAMLLWLPVKPVQVFASTLGVNYIQISPRLGTAGMPTRAQFAQIASAGYQTVINLAPDTVSNAHKDEPQLVAAQGMAYEHIPVDFARPTAADYAQFVAAMNKHAGRRVFVHCQVNMRASTFTYLYRVMELGEDPDRAFEAVQRVWQPSPPWRSLILEVHAARGKPLPVALER
jgi:uncharacterized protein (TIGR01244 family)